MPIFGEHIFNEIDTERIICITGVLSGGKTRLAFDLALPYWRKGYRVISNVPHNFSGDQGQPHLFNSFCILDEGGEYVRKAKTASMLTRSAGKANYYGIFSGKRLPHKELQGIVIRPRFDFYSNFGLPLILWTARIFSDVPYKISFIQYFPQALHGTYSTLSSSGGIEAILARAENTVNILAQMEGHEAGTQDEAGLLGFADDLAEGLGGSLAE